MSRVQGATELRRLIRNIPQAMRDELAVAMNEVGDEVLAEERRDTPVKTGRLRSALKKSRVTPKTLRLRIGLVTKATNRKFFYGWILNTGRRAQTVRVFKNGRNIKPSGVSHWRSRVGRPFYLMKVSPMRARPFVFARRAGLWDRFKKKLDPVWQRVLRRAAGG